MQYVLYCALTLLILYGIWFFRNIIRSGRAKKIHKEYQALLDRKLLPLGFEKRQTLVGGREKVAAYQKNALAFNLCYEVSFDVNRVDITNGKKSMSINISNTDEAKNNFPQILEEWLAENP
jgi:hypothetical protein